MSATNGVLTFQYWNGAVVTADGVVHGGSGTWDNVTANWTDVAGANSSAWQGGNNTAVFNAGSGTVTLGDNISAAELQFLSGSGAYNVVIAPNTTLTISGAGITNNSGVTQTFTTQADVMGNQGNLTCSNSATTGNNNTPIINNGGPVNGGVTFFENTSSAGSVSITNLGGTTTELRWPTSSMGP